MTGTGLSHSSPNSPTANSHPNCHLPWDHSGFVPAPLPHPLGTFQPHAGTPPFPCHMSKRVCASPTSSNPSRPGKPLASSSARPSLQVIKQHQGQDKLPAGLCTHRKSNGRKRESNRSQSQRVHFLEGSGRQLPSAARPGIVLPGAVPGKAASARPPGTSSCPFSRCQHLLSSVWLRCPSPKPGKILPRLHCSSRHPLLLVRRDGLHPGQEPLPETKGQARPAGSQPRANCPGDPAMCQHQRGPHDMQTAPGLPVGWLGGESQAGFEPARMSNGGRRPWHSSGERVKSPHPRPSHCRHLPSLIAQSQPCPRPAAITVAPVQREAALHLA